MKSITYIFIIAFFLTCSCSSDNHVIKQAAYQLSPDKTYFNPYIGILSSFDGSFNLSKRVFNGKVKSVKEECYIGKRDINGTVVSTGIRYYADRYYNIERLNNEYQFDAVGRIKKYSYSNNPIESSENDQRSTFSYKFNDQHLVTEILLEKDSVSERFLESGYSRQYNKEGKLISFSNFEQNNDGTNRINLDSTVVIQKSNEVLQIVNYYKDHNNKWVLREQEDKSIIEFQFNEAGKLKSESIASSYVLEKEGILKYEYFDEKLLKINTEDHKNSDLLIGGQTITFNSDKIVVSLINKNTPENPLYFTDEGFLLSNGKEMKSTFDKFDKWNNWTERHMIKSGGPFNGNKSEEILIVKRIINYRN